MWYKRRSHAQQAGTSRAVFVHKPGKDLARRSPRLCSVHAHENATCSYILLPRAVILSTTISRLFSLASFCSILGHFVAVALFHASGTSGAHTNMRLAHPGQSLYTSLGKTKRVVLSHGSALSTLMKMPRAPIYFCRGLSSCLPPSLDLSV